MFSSNEWIGWFKNWNEICDRKSIRPIILWYRRYVFRSQPNGCLSGVASGERQKRKKNNTRDSNVVPHRSTNLARSCLTSLSRREAVLSWLYGRSWQVWNYCCIRSRCLLRKYCIQVWHAWSKLCLFFFSLRFVVLVDAYWNIRGQCVIIWNKCKKYRNTCGEVTCTIF